MSDPLSWSFESFAFGTHPYALMRAGRPVDITPQAARLLELLLRSPGAIVRREAIRDHLWGEEVFVEFDQNINVLVRQLRKALGDDASAPRYIETVPTVGYRFVAEVSTPVPDHAVEPVPAPRRSRTISLAVAAIAVVAFLAVRALTGGSASEGAAHPTLTPQEQLATYAEAERLLLKGEPYRYGEGWRLRESRSLAASLLDAAVRAGANEAPLLGLSAFLESVDGDLETARERALHALARDPKDAWSRLTLASYDISARRDYRGALERLRTIEPAGAAACDVIALELDLMAGLGELETAREMAVGEAPRNCSPLRVTTNRMWLAFLARDWAATERLAREALAVEPQHNLAERVLFETLVRDPERRDEAVAMADAYLQAWGWPARSVSSPEDVYQLQLDHSNWSDDHVRNLVPEGLLLARLGRIDEALDALELGVAIGDPQALVTVGLDPRFDPLRGEPRFEAIVDRLGVASREP